MKTIAKEEDWTKRPTASIETRKRDLVIRISDWTKDRDEPAYDVEVYIAGVYDYNESKVFTTQSSGRTKGQAASAAIAFAQAQIEKLLGKAQTR